MIKKLQKLIKKTKGQGSIEYVILIALISIAVISSLALFAGETGVEEKAGECIYTGTSRDKLIGDYTYIKNGDTGITSIFRQVTCVIGGWKDTGEGENEDDNGGGTFIPGDDDDVNNYNKVLSIKDAKAAGFKFLPFIRSRIVGFDGPLDDGDKLVIPKIIINERNREIEVKSIWGGAFTNTKAKTIVVPEHVEIIYAGAFTNNPNLENVVILGKNTVVSRYAFPKDFGMRGKLENGSYSRQ